MAPSLAETVSQTADHVQNRLAALKLESQKAQTEQKKFIREPLHLSGALEAFKYFDVTPVIGREFENVDLAEWLRAPNSDELLRDLAITSTVPFCSRIIADLFIHSFSPRCCLLPEAGQSHQ